MRSYRVLMVTSECTPLAKSGGLADAVAALASQLSADGHDVRVLLPGYPHTPLGDKVGSIRIPNGMTVEEIQIYYTELPPRTIPVYLFSHRWFIHREGIYGDSDEGFYSGNARRFALFSAGAAYLDRTIDWTPDIIHSHDWPTALVAPYLANRDAGENERRKIGTILTLHNVGYQGEFPSHAAQYLGLPPHFFRGADGKPDVNFLRMGIESADAVTTVSPTYAREILEPVHSCGLDGVLNERKTDLSGVLNGVDYEIWNPATDGYLPARFDMDTLDRKATNKERLLRETGLAYRSPSADRKDRIAGSRCNGTDGAARSGDNSEPRPLIGMITRLAEQKGIYELWRRPDGFFHKFAGRIDADFIVLGVGETWCEEEIRCYVEEHFTVAAILKFDERLAHLIEGACDFFLMPSRYEPCGLNQMYSLRYGTLPIARRTGGLTDTIEPYDGRGGGTGFLFDEMSPRGIYMAVREAVEVWQRNPAHIRQMQRRAMTMRFSWEKSAREYVRVYDRVTGGTPSPGAAHAE